MDCIKIFKYLITSSVTPPNSHIRTKSMRLIDDGLSMSMTPSNSL
jgi:hypothetical protein